MYQSNRRTISNTLRFFLHPCLETCPLHSLASRSTSPGSSWIATGSQEKLENSFSLYLISIPWLWLHPVTKPFGETRANSWKSPEQGWQYTLPLMANKSFYHYQKYFWVFLPGAVYNTECLLYGSVFQWLAWGISSGAVGYLKKNCSVSSLPQFWVSPSWSMWSILNPAITWLADAGSVRSRTNIIKTRFDTIGIKTVLHRLSHTQ